MTDEPDGKSPEDAAPGPEPADPQTPTEAPPPAGVAPAARGESPPEKAPPETNHYPDIDRVIIWAWPKTIVFWPTCVLAFVFGFIAAVTGTGKAFETIKVSAANAVLKVDSLESDVEAKRPSSKKALADVKTDLKTISTTVDRLNPERGRVLGILFLAVFVFNLIAFSFDVRVKGLAIAISTVCALVFLLLFLSVAYDLEILHKLREVLMAFSPVANAAFYLTIGGFMLLVLLAGMWSTYLRRCEVSHNEMIIRTGLLEAEKRITTQRLTFHKKVEDLMEHWVLFFGLFSRRLGCGRLVFSHPQLPEPIVLDNVIGLEAKADRLGKILGVLAVRDKDYPPK